MENSIGLKLVKNIRGQKFNSSARNYELNLERTSNSSQSTRPTGLTSALGRSHITPLCSLLHRLLKGLQDK